MSCGPTKRDIGVTKFLFEWQFDDNDARGAYTPSNAEKSTVIDSSQQP